MVDASSAPSAGRSTSRKAASASRRSKVEGAIETFVDVVAEAYDAFARSTVAVKSRSGTTRKRSGSASPSSTRA